jgi:hypothetical protein
MLRWQHQQLLRQQRQQQPMHQLRQLNVPLVDHVHVVEEMIVEAEHKVGDDQDEVADKNEQSQSSNKKSSVSDE